MHDSLNLNLYKKGPQIFVHQSTHPPSMLVRQKKKQNCFFFFFSSPRPSPHTHIEQFCADDPIESIKPQPTASNLSIFAKVVESRRAHSIIIIIHSTMHNLVDYEIDPSRRWHRNLVIAMNANQHSSRPLHRSTEIKRKKNFIKCITNKLNCTIFTLLFTVILISTVSHTTRAQNKDGAPTLVHPGIISRVSQQGLNLLAEYLRTRVQRFMRFSAFQYNFNVGVPNNNIEIGIRSLDTAYFDSGAFHSRFSIVVPSKELIWSGSDFRASINSLVQLRSLDRRDSQPLLNANVPLKLERVRVELILGPSVNQDGHLRTDVRQCRIVSGELLYDNLIREAGNFTTLVPLIHQITLARLSEMFCPVFVAELGPVISNRLLNTPLSTALFDHYFLNYGLTNGIMYQPSMSIENRTTMDPGGGGGILLFHRGNVFGILRQGKTRINDFRLPILPKPMVPSSSGSVAKRMVVFQLSNYTLSSLFFWMDQYRKFDYEISKTTVKDKEIAAYLKTECGPKEICAGTLFPALAQNFPNGLVSIKSRTLTYPTILIERNRINVLVESRIDAFANYSEHNRRFLTATMRAKLQLQNTTFVNYVFSAELSIDTFDITNVVSLVDGIDAGSIEFLVNALNELIIADDMRHKLKEGVRLPVLLDFEQFGSGEVRLEEGAMLLGADLCFDELCKRPVSAELSKLSRESGNAMSSMDMDANYYDSV
uniref:Lipid-binding serum glycoprotein C-terminal domain-containing protein n=1 Tax=Globodera rostochiensis TaxID=31243 RepID=A0A914HM80_GLORO